MLSMNYMFTDCLGTGSPLTAVFEGGGSPQSQTPWRTNLVAGLPRESSWTAVLTLLCTNVSWARQLPVW